MWVFMSTVITIGAHALLAFSFVNPYVGTIIMGMAYSMLASSLWPLVALIIPEYQLGTAYGICQSVQNLGLAVVSMFAGVIVDRGGYLMLELFFIGWLSSEWSRRQVSNENFHEFLNSSCASRHGYHLATGLQQQRSAQHDSW
jgi:MFS family permease